MQSRDGGFYVMPVLTLTRHDHRISFSTILEINQILAVWQMLEETFCGEVSSVE